MMRLCKGMLSFAAFLWLLGSTSPLAFAQEKKTFVAFSMKVAQARVEEAVRKREDFRKKQPDLYYLGGITKPLAVVLDTKTGDWILVGEQDPKCSLLTLDDWVASLRARFIHAGTDPSATIDPGVTIDPRPCEACLEAGKKESCSHYTRQDVRFFGGIENTHFAQVCYEADWLMKRTGLALEKLPVEKLKTHYDLSVEQARNAGWAKTMSCSRFWFYPIVNRVNVIGDVVLLEKFQMGVFTEVLYAEVDGKPVANVDNFEDYPSEGFSRSFSENYDAAAEAREVLETLRGLTRLAALAKGLTRVDAKPNVDFYLKGYPMEKVETPKEVEVLRVENREVGLEICGGADLMALTMRLKGGDVSAFKELVLVARKVAGAEALSWEFKAEMEGGQLKDVKIPPRLVDTSQIASLFQQAVFLQAKKHYDAAIECYDKIIGLNPNDAEAYLGRAAARGLRGDGKAVLTDINKALEIDPKYGYAYTMRGLVHKLFGDIEAALNDFDSAIRLKGQTDPIDYIGRAGVFAMKGDYEAAWREDQRAMDLDPNIAEVYAGRAFYHATKGRFRKAHADIKLGLSIDPNCTEIWLVKAMVHDLEGDRDESIVALRKSIEVAPPAYANSPAMEKVYELLQKMENNKPTSRSSEKSHFDFVDFERRVGSIGTIIFLLFLAFRLLRKAVNR